jgi:hypothetical protein
MAQCDVAFDDVIARTMPRRTRIRRAALHLNQVTEITPRKKAVQHVLAVRHVPMAHEVGVEVSTGVPLLSNLCQSTIGPPDLMQRKTPDLGLGRPARTCHEAK